ncbi:MAG: FIST C-terminal domain-containing protein [Pseudomonadota bacterium]
MMHVALDGGGLDALLAQWQAAAPRAGVLALLPEAEAGRLPLLQAACRARDIPLHGALFPALLVDSGFSNTGAWLLRLDAMPPAFLLPATPAEGKEDDPAAELAESVEAALDAQPPAAGKPTLFMIFDGMRPDIGSILDRLYLRLADRVSYAGVNAGSETFQPMPCLFDRERLIGGGLLALLLPGDPPFAIEHGYQAPEQVMIATASSGNRIISIDWRPAFDVYREIVRREYGVELTRENFYGYGVHFPFGILHANGEVVVRIPVALTDDGALHCIGEVPENTLLVLLRAPEACASRCFESLVDGLSAGTGTARGMPLLAFYCAGRRLHLGAAAATELAELQRRTGAAIVGGALSLGEIGHRAASYPLFHNAALLCRAWQQP